MLYNNKEYTYHKFSMINRFEQCSSSWSERRLIFEVSPEQPQKKVAPAEASEPDNEGTQEQEEARQERKKVKAETQKEKRELNEDIDRQGRRAIAQKIDAEKKNDPDAAQQKPSQKNPVPPPEQKKGFGDMISDGLDKLMKLYEKVKNYIAVHFALTIAKIRNIPFIKDFFGDQIKIFDAIVPKEQEVLFRKLKKGGVVVTLNDSDPESDSKAIAEITRIGKEVSGGDAEKLEEFFAAVTARYLADSGKTLENLHDLIPVAEEEQKSQPVKPPEKETPGNINLKSGKVEKITIGEKEYQVKILGENGVEVDGKKWKAVGKSWREGSDKPSIDNLTVKIETAEWQVADSQLVLKINGEESTLSANDASKLLAQLSAYGNAPLPRTGKKKIPFLGTFEYEIRYEKDV